MLSKSVAGLLYGNTHCLQDPVADKVNGCNQNVLDNSEDPNGFSVYHYIAILII